MESEESDRFTIEEAASLFKHIENAREDGLETEFVWSFLRALGCTKSSQFGQAIFEAYCEWDL